MRWYILVLIAVAVILATTIFIFYILIPAPLGITLKVENVNYGQPMNFTVLFKKTPENGVLLYRVWINNQMLEEWEPMNFQQGDKLTLIFNSTGTIVNSLEVIFDRGGYKKALSFPLIEGKEFHY